MHDHGRLPKSALETKDNVEMKKNERQAGEKFKVNARSVQGQTDRQIDGKELYLCLL